MHRLEKVVGGRYLNGDVSIGHINLVQLEKVRDALAGVESNTYEPEPYFQPPAED